MTQPSTSGPKPNWPMMTGAKAVTLAMFAGAVKPARNVTARIAHPYPESVLLVFIAIMSPL